MISISYLQMVIFISTLWLMILYLLGGLMSRFEIPAKLSAPKWAGLYLLAVAGSYLPRMP